MKLRNDRREGFVAAPLPSESFGVSELCVSGSVLSWDEKRAIVGPERTEPGTDSVSSKDGDGGGSGDLQATLWCSGVS